MHFQRRGPIIGILLVVLILVVIGMLVFAVMSGIETEWKMYSILAVVFASIATIIAIVFTVYYFATSKGLDKFSAAYKRKVDAIGATMTAAAARARATGQAIVDFPGVQFNKAVMSALQRMSPEQQVAFINNAVKNDRVAELLAPEAKAAVMSEATAEVAKSPEAQREDAAAVAEIVAALPPPPPLATGPAFAQTATSAPAAATTGGARPWKAGLSADEQAACAMRKKVGMPEGALEQQGCY